MLDSLKKLYSVPQLRSIDRAAAQQPGCTGTALMERAGAVAFAMLRRLWPTAQRLTVLCGPGNNGGDGYVLARLAHLAGFGVQLVPLAGLPRAGSEADLARQWFTASGGVEEANWQAALGGAELCVDALLGTGTDRPVNGPMALAVAELNAQTAPVLALDVPSGINADTGQVMGVAVRASATISFVARKLGLYTGPARECCGRLEFDDLGVPEVALAAAGEPAAVRLDLPSLRTAFLAPRLRHVHKGSFGHVLVIGGDDGYGGAVRLAGEAAARSGAGLTTVATRPQHVAALVAGRPELMVTGITGGADIAPLLTRASVLAVGPGLGQGDFGRELFARALGSGLPMVVDADALNILASDGRPLRRDDWILTPHPGEAARLLGSTVEQVEADRYASARALQLRFGGVVVLKGAGTVVCDGHSPLGVVPYGNPGMASGGMGDVLTGVIAGLWAQGLSAGVAAALGACLHAVAADRVAARQGERGLLAGDLLAALPALLNGISDGADLGA